MVCLQTVVAGVCGSPVCLGAVIYDLGVSDGVVGGRPTRHPASCPLQIQETAAQSGFIPQWVSDYITAFTIAFLQLCACWRPAYVTAIQRLHSLR